MKKYFKVDKWNIIEEGFDKKYNRTSESIMSLANGHMGIRGNFAEKYSGDSLQGTYIAGVYYPDKTVVGWWKNGYPEYFAKIANAANFIGINVQINNLQVDLNKCNFIDFSRTLNMKDAFLKREFTLILPGSSRVKIREKRFLHQIEKELAAVSYQIKPLDKKINIQLTPYLDGNVKNEDANYGDLFWNNIEQKSRKKSAYLSMETKKSFFLVSTAMNWEINSEINSSENIEKKNFTGNKINLTADRGEEIILNKYIAVCTSRDYNKNRVREKAVKLAAEAAQKGYADLFAEHKKGWSEIWQESDIKIEGDPEAQQGIRFNIFQLNQTYTGHDPRLNIGPKGFTGEKYGGLTYWDTEAYCLPFYLATHSSSVGRNLLLYRYHHLDKAVENADKLGLKGALYPMVTITGEECHNEWEITFEEIHRNGAVAHAVKDYIDYTGDKKYLKDFGFPVLAEISKFWEDRVTYNPRKDKYMILGVTGPNEYENNINNNWYTNKIAVWTLKYTLQAKDFIKKEFPKKYSEWIDKLDLTEDEFNHWRDIVNKMYYPYLEDYNIYSQQDGYLDKEQKTREELKDEDIPLYKNWSWDRILRSPYIKQADVLQGIYYFKEEFDNDSIKRHFEFYEPRTVHESSLSPCIYSIIASEIGNQEKAYQLYLRTSRLDLDNYNYDTDEGLHITSMAGTWMSIVKGFAGFEVKNNKLYFRPFLPEKWHSFNFKIIFRNRRIKVHIGKEKIKFELEKGKPLKISVYGQDRIVEQSSCITLKNR
ncbi:MULTISPECIES: family 65 glycosyl hydrolase domain-containing protein [unclassified Halanaerobium]|uniref:family 65 glycosyl hydrolase domain-containing protein n=1 Tax=unclassified Halanaerobium TaxID=2641197 RepID=UPI000DF17893|nr:MULTISPECIES: family 65 glycosyl hydrolase domain-containing protein [unclassified Halanaerobium]RCW45036.1 maltose phosphorylase [Halanaerobium sp. MA284_MarDTE_T2]RCW83317.1 maltose phosphorylase [Halanaerobium sp. DL-01]